MASLSQEFEAFRKAKTRVAFANFRRERLKGEAGEVGPQGPQGLPGAPGTSVSVEEVIERLLTMPSFLKALERKESASDIISTQIDEELDEKMMEKIVGFMKTQQFHDILPKQTYIGSAGASTARVAALENSGGKIVYTEVTASGTTTFTRETLPFATNIIGVNASGPVTLRLPNNLVRGTIVKIKDESLSADTNNITVETYEVS